MKHGRGGKAFSPYQTMKSTKNKLKNLILSIINRPISVGLVRKSLKATDEEISQGVKKQSIRQFAYCFFAGCIFFVLSILFFVIHYFFHFDFDDPVYSIAALFVLMGSSLLVVVAGSLVYLKHCITPFLGRLFTDLYFLSIVVVIGLCFYAIGVDPILGGQFNPSFLYILVIVVCSSPYLFDSLFFYISSLAVVITTTALHHAADHVFMQYILIGLILLGAMLYLSALSFGSNIKTQRLDKTNRQLLFLSSHDQLTGLHNRHFLHEFIDREWLTLCHSSSFVGFIIFDIDSFKSYNDNLSHVAGDKCLQEVANAIARKDFFPIDNFYRYGGDEFLIVLPNVTQEDLTRIGNGIVEAVSSMKMKSGPCAPYPFVTISAGGYLAKMDEKDKIEDYISQADKMLYVAKSKGHNQFES